MSHDAVHNNASLNKLIYMANQIGKAFARRTHEEAISEISSHIKKFWEKRMLAQIFLYLDEDGSELDELPKQSLQKLRGTTQ
jgi:formate dehydrogenase subunit delta